MIRETTALGAAYLAGLATGVWRDLNDIKGQWTLDKLHEPQMEAALCAGAGGRLAQGRGARPGLGVTQAGKARCRYNKINADKSSRGGETRRGCFCCTKFYFQGLSPAKKQPGPVSGRAKKEPCAALSIKTRLVPACSRTITAEQTVCGAGCPARRYSRHAAAGRADAAGEGKCAMEILRVEDVGHKYQAENGEVTAFEHISFTVQKGECMSIVGPSGCGKSTLLSIIAGLLPPTSGRVYVDGEVVTGISRHIGYMLQRDNLLEWRTILDNVLFGLEIQRRQNAAKRGPGPSACWRPTACTEFAPQIPAPAFRRHAPARRAHPHTGGRAGYSAAGRGVFGPGLSDAPDRHRRCVPHFEAGGRSPR